MKKLVYMGMVLSLMFVILLGMSANASASSLEGQNDATVRARVELPQEEVFAAVVHIAASGIVDGSGVRLRKRPASTSAIVGLMSAGEYVDIYYSESTTNWYYLKRLKNNTRGYARKEFICAF